jgi:hypothetical protein
MPRWEGPDQVIASETEREEGRGERDDENCPHPSAPDSERHVSDDMQACHLAARHLRLWRTNVQNSTAPYLPTARSFQTRESGAQWNATSTFDALQTASCGNLVLDGGSQKLLQIAACAW